MPCGDSRDHVSYEDLEKANQEGLELKKLLDERTAMLCEAMGELERLLTKGGVGTAHLSQGLTEWWKAHKRWDAERRERER